MNFLKSMTFFVLVFGLTAYGIDDEPGKRLDGLFTKLVSSDENVRQSAVLELVEKTESKDMAHTVEWLLVVKRLGIFKATVLSDKDKGKDNVTGYQFLGCMNRHLCGEGYTGYGYGVGYYGGWYFHAAGGAEYSNGYSVAAKNLIEENRKMLETTREAATRSIRALGDKSVGPLIDLYTKRPDQDVLDLLGDIARSEKHGDAATTVQRAATRKRIYTFLSETYMKLANERE